MRFEQDNNHRESYEPVFHNLVYWEEPENEASSDEENAGSHENSEQPDQLKQTEGSEQSDQENERPNRFAVDFDFDKEFELARDKVRDYGRKHNRNNGLNLAEITIDEPADQENLAQVADSETVLNTGQFDSIEQDVKPTDGDSQQSLHNDYDAVFKKDGESDASLRSDTSPVSRVLSKLEPVFKQLQFSFDKLTGGKLQIKIAIAAVAVLVVVVWYGASAAKYNDSYFPNTEVFGVNIGAYTPAEVQQLANSKIADYSVHVAGSSVDVVIPGKEIGLSFKSGDTAQTILKQQNTMLWPIMQLLPHNVTDAFELTYNQDSLLGAVRQATAAQNDASLQAADQEVYFDRDDNLWKYEPVSAGITVNAELLAAALDKPIRELRTEFTVPASCVSRVDLQGTDSLKFAAAEKANELCSKYNLVFTLGESTPLTIDAGLVADWIVIDDEFRVSVSEGKMTAWLNSLRNLLSGADERTYTRPDGKVCTVTGGDYGWRATNVDEAISTIRTALETGISGQNIPCSQEGSGFLGIPGADWGKRYADVDMIEQHARFYDSDGSLIWESDIITGVWGTDFETPTGVYTLTEKRSPAQLRSVGEYRYIDENGEPQVEENHVFGRDVEYWMPFIGTFIGFHDAWWQTSFGGQLYRNASLGSGGCINLPSDKAQELYGILRPGDVVVTHN